MYLPGIGEAIGSGIRMRRQNELMEQSQKILQDESKPWSERVALVTAAHPELATNPQLQQMLETGRQADQDKRLNAKYKREEEAAATAQNFRDALTRIPKEQQRAFILANPDQAALVVPESLKQYQGEVKAEQENATWLERFNVAEQGRNARNAATNAATLGRDAQQAERDRQKGIADGSIDPVTGQLIPYAQRKEADQQRDLATDLAKKQQTKQVDADVQRAAIPAFVAELEAYRDLGAETGGETFGADAAKLKAQRKALATQLAKQMAGPGMATNKQDVEDAEALIPEPGYTTLGTTFSAAVDEIIRQQKNKLIGSQGVTVD